VPDLPTRVLMGPLTRALIVENPHTALDRLLTQQGMVATRLPDAPDRDTLRAALQQTRAQVLFKRSRVPVTRELVQACPDLVAVQLCCIGDDSVDKQACADHGIMVFNDPVSNGRSVVELVIAHLIALSRRLYETDRECRAGGWDKGTTERYEIQGKTLGILGLGNIGRAVARSCQALGMKIRFHDSREVAVELGQELGWTFAPTIEDLFRGSDYVTAHLSATDVERRSNTGILDGGVMELLGADLPPDSPRIFLNLARGFLHTPDSLLSAVRSRAIRRAAVDVYPKEPCGPDEAWPNPYADEPRVAVTPHIGASTLEAQPRIARRVAETFGAFSRFGSVRDCVYSPRTQLSLMDNGKVGQALLCVSHVNTRGTKRAIDEAIFDAGASNLSSQHRDFDHLGMAYDLAALDRPLDEAQIRGLIEWTASVTGEPGAIRSVRQVVVS